MKWKKIGSRQVSLLSLSFSHDAQINVLKQYLGLGYTRRVIILENDVATAFCYKKEFQDLEKFLTKKIIQEKGFINHNVVFFHRTIKNLAKKFDFIKNHNLQKFSNQKLYELLSKIGKDYKSFLIFGPLTGRIISAAFQENILTWAKKEKLDIRKIKNHISQLVIPVGENINTQEEMGLIEIAKKVNKQNKIVNIFNKDKIPKIIFTLQNNSPSLFKEIYKHYENYNWLPMFFENPAWSLSYFIKKIRQLLKDENYITRLKEIQNTRNKISSEQKKLVKELKLTPDIIKFIYQAGQYLVLRALFAQHAGYVNYNLRFLYKELARRYGLRLKDFKYLTIQEIYEFLSKNKKIATSVIDGRQKLCILDSHSDRHQILIGEKANKIKKELNKLTNIHIDKTRELKGSIANEGKVRGRVKIIYKQDDIKKFKKGEILVASMTSVDMISAIKKAGALVTDEGGLTCHAAIVSREFNIPCIIGTRVATKVLKNGMLVEVKANHGIVKILKK